MYSFIPSIVFGFIALRIKNIPSMLLYSYLRCSIFFSISDWKNENSIKTKAISAV